MAQLTAQQVADYIIAFANEAGSSITNLKLQKMVYYAQGYYLALNNEKLFDDRIEAWVHGPVLPVLYHKYKEFRWQSINVAVDVPTISQEIKNFLDLVIETFLPMDAFKLERMTHEESPWLNARGDLEATAKCNKEITPSDMKEYFSALV